MDDDTHALCMQITRRASANSPRRAGDQYDLARRVRVRVTPVFIGCGTHYFIFTIYQSLYTRLPALRTDFIRAVPNPPDPIQLQHSDTLSRLIRDEIRDNQGWIGFDRFMDLALYSRGLGYYSAGSVKLGADGDFVTAPELGSQFAGCIARQCMEIFDQQEKISSSNQTSQPSRTIIEFGAGAGKLARDILNHFKQSGSRMDQYLIMETSPELKHRQKQTIAEHNPEFLQTTSWLTDLPESGLHGVVIANELLDALPVTRFEIDHHGAPLQIGVGLENEEFRYSLSSDPLAPGLAERLSRFDLPAGYQSEIGAAAEAWLRTIGEQLSQGVILVIDYGFPQREFYHRERMGGTLMCHYRHTAHDNPFLWPGLQDITAHVDFSALAATAQETGMELAGYCNQAAFLLSLQLLEFSHDGGFNDESFEQPDPESLARNQEIRKLTLPHEMGELFKVLALTRNHEAPLSGFTMQNYRHRL